MIISVINQKGGVAKTISTFNVAAILANMGKKVCMIDIDPQSSLTIAAGIEHVEKSMYDVICKKENIENTILKLKENLYIAPSTLNLSIAELELVSQLARESVLRKSLSKIKKEFDYIIIDCPPSLSLLTVNSLVASDNVLVTVSTDFLALKGLELLLNTIGNVKSLNENLAILGVVATLYDKRTNHSREVLEFLKEEYKVLGTIKQSVVVKDSILANKALIDFEPQHETTLEYIKVAKEIIANE